MTSIAQSLKLTRQLNRQFEILSGSVNKLDNIVDDLNKDIKTFNKGVQKLCVKLDELCKLNFGIQNEDQTKNIWVKKLSNVWKIATNIYTLYSMIRDLKKITPRIMPLLKGPKTKIKELGVRTKQVPSKIKAGEVTIVPPRIKEFSSNLISLAKNLGMLVRAKVTGILQSAGGLLMGWFSKLTFKIRPILKRIISGLGTILLRFISRSGPLILRLLSKVIPVLGIISIIVEILWQIGKVIYSNWDKIVAWFGTVKEQISGKINELKLIFMEKFTAFKTWLIQKTGEITTDIISKGIEFKEALITKVSEMKENFLTRFTEIKDGIIGKFEEIKNKALEFGKGIIDNLIEGITQNPQKLMDALKSLLPEGLVGKLENLGVNFQFPQAKTAALGLPYVPYDNYPALLHRGEQVLTRAEADQYRQSKNVNNNPVLNITINAANMNEDQIVSMVENRLVSVVSNMAIA